MPALQPPDSAARVRAGLDAYFRELLSAQSTAARQQPVPARGFDLAGHGLVMHAAGAALHEALTSAFTHLPNRLPSLPASLEVFAWDEAATGVALPEAPWPPPPVATIAGAPRLTLPPGGEAYRIALTEQESFFIFYSMERRQAVIWTRDAARLPTYVHSAPFPALVHWWSQQHGLRLLHAGCVGTPAGAALLVGKSGSGKSTTALHCALNGLRYLSDDLCLVRPHPTPHAWCVFSSGKLLPDSLARFPELASRARPPLPGVEGKPVVFMHEHDPATVAVEMPLKVVVAPRVTGKPETRWEPLSAAEALKALAPSSILPRSHPEPEAFHDMARLVRSLPCYRLELGTRLEEVSAALRHLVEVS